MSFLPFALSLSSTFTKIGAIAAFGALVGIAMLSLLVFSQARELKRLREWAGRAPERAADLEQRVSAAASVRAQQQAPPGQPPRVVPAAAAAGAAAGATRVVATPISPAAAAAAVPAAQAVSAPGAPPAAAAPVAPASGVPSPAPAQPVTTAQPRPVPPTAPPRTAATPMPVGAPVSAAAAAQSRPAPAVPVTPSALAGDPRAPAPATAAAAAGVAAAGAPRSPIPPRQPGANAAAPSAPTQQPPRRPPAPAVPVAPAPANSRAPAAAGQPPRAAAVSPLQGGRSVYAAKRSPRRTAALIVGALVLVGVVAALAVTLLGGSSGTKAPTASVGTTPATQATASHPRRKSHEAAHKTTTINPAETNVTVLNATEVAGLAARTATQLQQGGYTKAAALHGKPPGTGQLSVVEYTGGHRTEAEAVAHAVSVTHVLPIEAAVTADAGSANVVVIVGADKASP